MQERTRNAVIFAHPILLAYARSKCGTLSVTELEWSPSPSVLDKYRLTALSIKWVGEIILKDVHTFFISSWNPKRYYQEPITIMGSWYYWFCKFYQRVCWRDLVYKHELTLLVIELLSIGASIPNVSGPTRELPSLMLTTLANLICSLWFVLTSSPLAFTS